MLPPNSPGGERHANSATRPPARAPCPLPPAEPSRPGGMGHRLAAGRGGLWPGLVRRPRDLQTKSLGPHTGEVREIPQRRPGEAAEQQPRPSPPGRGKRAKQRPPSTGAACTAAKRAPTVKPRSEDWVFALNSMWFIAHKANPGCFALHELPPACAWRSLDGLASSASAPQSAGNDPSVLAPTACSRGFLS